MSFQFSNLFSLNTFRNIVEAFSGDKEKSGENLYMLDRSLVGEIQTGGRVVRVLSDKEYKEYLANRDKPQKEQPSNPVADKELLQACQTGDMDAFEAAVKNGANVNCVGYNSLYAQIRPLHLTARHGHVDMTRKLLKLGARPDVLMTSNNDYEPCYDTPAHLARVAGHEEIHTLLKNAEKARGTFLERLMPWRSH